MRRTPNNTCETQMDVAAHADTIFEDKETKVMEEILTMILSSNASTVRNLVKLERTRKDLSGHQRSVL